MSILIDTHAVIDLTIFTANTGVVGPQDVALSIIIFVLLL